MFSTRSDLEKKLTGSVTGGYFSTPRTKCYTFESNSRILIKFRRLIGNMVRKTVTYELSLRTYQMILEFMVLWNEAIFQMSYYISGIFCAIVEISISISTYSRSRITKLI